MIGPSPVRFHAVVAAVALSGAVLLADGKPPRPVESFTFADPAIDESSGLVAEGETVLTINDSGAGPVVLVVDPRDGRTTGRTTYSSDAVVDVEAIAAGPDGSVWVGDIGDNGGRRASITVYKLPPVEPGDRTVEAQRFELRYVDGPKDAETLLVDPRDGRLYVVSKGLFGGTVYAAPARLPTGGPAVLRPVGEVSGMVTDGAFVADGRHVVVRTYSSAAVLDTSDWSTLGRFGLPHQQQGEGLAVVDDGRRLLLSSEGAGSEVLTVRIPAALVRAMAPPSPSPSPTPSEPASSGSEGGTSSTVADDGWTTRTWTGVVLLGAVGIALVATVASHLRSRRRRL